MHRVSAKGVKVPALGLGTWELEGQACVEGVQHALDIGYRHIDTAQLYGNEEQVGQAMARSGVERDEVFLTTKLNHRARAPEQVGPATEASLRKLGVERIDLLLIHWPSAHVPVAATLEAMARLQDDGKVAHLGVSNFPPSLLRAAVREAPIITDQVEYHPLLDQDALLEVCREEDLFLTAYAPVARGRIVEEVPLKEIAAEHGKTVCQVALRWLIQQDRVAAIPKSASPERRAENADIFDFTLSEEEMSRIHALARGERIVDPAFAPDWER